MVTYDVTMNKAKTTVELFKDISFKKNTCITLLNVSTPNIKESNLNITKLAIILIVTFYG